MDNGLWMTKDWTSLFFIHTKWRNNYVTEDSLNIQMARTLRIFVKQMDTGYWWRIGLLSLYLLKWHLRSKIFLATRDGVNIQMETGFNGWNESTLRHSFLNYTWCRKKSFLAKRDGIKQVTDWIYQRIRISFIIPFFWSPMNGLRSGYTGRAFLVTRDNINEEEGF